MKRFIWTKRVFEWDEAAQKFVTLEKEGYWYDGPMALCMDDPTMRQLAIQVFNDDGTDETDSTSKAGIGVDITGQALDENFLVRFVVDENAGNANANYSCQLEVRLEGGAYQNVNGSSTIARSFDSTKLTEDADTTQRTGSGTFLTANMGQDDVDGTAGGQTPDYVGNDEAEFVFCIQGRSADINGGENIEVRLAVADIDTYVDPEIKITFAAAAALIEPPLVHSFAVARAANY